MDKLNLVVMAKDMDLRVKLKNTITDEDLVIAGYTECSDAGKLKIQGLFPDVIIIAERGDIGQDLLDYVQALLCDIHSVSVMLLTDNVSVDLVNSAAEVGIKKVLPLDTPGAELMDAIRKINHLEVQRNMDSNEGKRVRSKAISFFGGKGGTGKTTMAVNVACALARENKKVILIDLDLAFGDVALSLDMEPKETLVELVQDREGITIENIKNFAVVHSTGLNVLCAPKSPEYSEYIKPANVETLIDVLRPYYEYIIMDLAPSFSDAMITAVENSDEVFLVYSLDILSLRNAKVSVDVLTQLQQKEKLRLLINKETKGLVRDRDFEKLLGIPPYGTVSLDERAALASINKGLPVILAEPHSTVAREFTAIAHNIIEEHTGVKLLDVIDTGKKKKKKKPTVGGPSAGGAAPGAKKKKGGFSKRISEE